MVCELNVMEALESALMPIAKAFVRGHYRRVGSKNVYVRPYTTCRHDASQLVHVGARFRGRGRVQPIRLCSKCGRIWRLRYKKSLGRWVLAKAIPLKPGQRWITVHPHGEDEPGIPVLIQEHADGTASVIRGAGGKLNYLRLTRLRKPEEWRASREEVERRRKEVRERRQAELTEEERKREKEFKHSLIQSKQLRDAEFVSTVLEAHGITEDQWKLPEKVLQAMPEKSREMAERQHLRKMVSFAKQLAQQARQDILAAQDKAVHEALGDIPGEAILPPEPVTGKGAGYAAAINRKAEENGLTPQELKREKADISWRHFLEAADGNEIEAMKKAACVERLHQALAEVRAPVIEARQAGLLDVDLKPKQPDVQDIAKILIADKKHSDIERRYELVKREVEDAGVPKSAFIAAKDAVDVEALADKAVSGMSDDEAKETLARELEEDAMQLAASRLLEHAEAETDRGALREHLGVGHYAGLNEATLAATKSPCPIDRITADILGPAATAQLLVEQWRRELPPEELDAIREGIVNHHIKRQREIAEAATKRYEELISKANQLEIPKITDEDTLMTAQLVNDEKADLVMEARRELGVALGRLEAQAAIVEAFEEGSPNELRVSLGKVSNEQAVQLARVLGLKPEDYQIDSDGINKFLTVRRNGIDRLVGSIDHEFAERVRVAEEIKSGARDEENWLPKGIVSRPATTFDDPRERALMVTEPLVLRENMTQPELEEALEDYIGGRLADGQDPESLRSDLLSAEFVSECVPKALLGKDSNGPYYQALKNLGFFSYKQVENATGEELTRRAEAIVEKRRRKLGESANIAALNAQSIPLSDATYDAVHRAMAKVPHAQVVIKGIGELNPQDKGVLRDFFWAHMTSEKQPVAAETRRRREEERARAEEVVGYQHTIFGDVEEVKRGDVQPKEDDTPRETAWDRYVRAMGGTDRAYAAIQDIIRGQFVAEFAKQLGAITGTEFKTGTKRIAHWDRHVLGILPPERQAQLLGERALSERRKQAYVATRVGGRFAKEDAAGARKEKAEALLRAIKQSQLALFRTGNDPRAERITLGERAEAQLAKVLPIVARNFDPKKPVEIPKDVSMSGKFSLQQRAIKLLEANKRVGLHLGVGSGKSLIALGSFAHLHSKGKVKRAIFAVPSVVQAQFGSEALRYFEPGKYRWFANPAATAEERRAAYADPDRHIVVVTHQALRDDLTHLVAQHKFGGNVDRAAQWLRTASEEDRKNTMREAMDAAGWKFEMSVVDEGHDLLNRKGKPNSRMANAIDALAFNTPYHATMTADPIKNDASEAFDVLHKLDPKRYSDAAAFHRKYGVDTAASRAALQQELSPYTITGRIRPEVEAGRNVRTHDLTASQQKLYREVMANYRRAQQAARAGHVDIDAIRAMSPHAFRGLSEDQARDKAAQLSRFLSATRDMALDRIINLGHVDREVKDAPCGKLNDLIAFVESKRNPDGTVRPGVVFAHSREAVKRIKSELAKRGLRVVTLTGEHSGADKEKAKLAFQNGDADVIVLSDAGSVGANLQRGAWEVQYDTPDTAKTYEQRIGRIERLGQTNPDIEVAVLASNTPYERARRKRLATKSELREIFTSPTEMLDDTGLAHEIWVARQKQLHKDVLTQAA